MAHADIIRKNDNMPEIPDISEMTTEERVNVLYNYIRMQNDYIVRLKEQIGYELDKNKKE